MAHNKWLWVCVMVESHCRVPGTVGKAVPQRKGEGRESEEYYFLISVLQLRKGCVVRFHVPQLPPAACSHPRHVCHVFVTAVASGSTESGPSIH